MVTVFLYVQLSVLTFQCIGSAFVNIKPSDPNPEMEFHPELSPASLEGAFIPVVGFVIHTCLQVAGAQLAPPAGRFQSVMQLEWGSGMGLGGDPHHDWENDVNGTAT